MTLLNSASNGFQRKRRRTSTIMAFTPQVGRGPKLKPGTGAPYTQPGVSVTPLGQSKPMTQTSARGSQDRQTDTTPMTSSMPEKSLPKTSRITNKNSRRGKPKKGKDHIYYPRGGRPENEKPGIKFTSADNIPSGEVPYRDGEAVITSSFPIGKIGELANLPQTLTGWDRSAQEINNIRCLFQVIRPNFFGQMPSFIRTGALDTNLDTTHDRVWKTIFNQMREIYQDNFNINKSFEDNFKYDLVFIYFHDTFALFAELVCYYQRAAYYRDDNAKMENVLLDTLSLTLNNDDFTPIRNRMARAIRFNYLPQQVIDRTYEIFQTYRLGEQATSGSSVFVTPAMSQLIKSLGDVTTITQYNTAVSVYSATIDSLIDKVLFGRLPVATTSPGIIRYCRTSDAAGAYNSSELQSFPLFASGEGELTEKNISSLNSFLGRISRYTNLTLLNNQRRGNSQSHYNIDFSDLFNAQMVVGSGDTELFPSVVSVGDNTTVSPSIRESVVYASERREQDVLYKSTSLQLDKFAGGGDLLFQTWSNSSAIWSRFYLVERDRVGSTVPDNADIRSKAYRGYTQIGNSLHNFIQDNYTTKVFVNQANTEMYSVNNADGTSAAQYFLTFGDLLECQYKEGIDF